MQTSYELEANFSLQWNLLSWSWREINRLAFWILSIALSMSAAIIKWILTSFVIRLPCFFVLYWPELFHDFIPGTISIWVSDSQFKGIRHQKYFRNNLAPIAECVTHIFHNQGQFYCYPYTEDHYMGGGGLKGMLNKSLLSLHNGRRSPFPPDSNWPLLYLGDS